MKVYGLPKEVPAPVVNYGNYNRDEEVRKEDEHLKALAAWLRKAGYTGKRTGEEVNFHVADGYARYMLADGKKSALIHLPYGDGYSYPDVRFLPKKEILRRIDADKAWRKTFTKRKEESKNV